MTSAEPTQVHDLFSLAGTTLEGRFEVARAIAEGGFGVVYQARQAALDRLVAVKVLKTPCDLRTGPKLLFLEVFATEARTIARITHPNIVHVHDFGVSMMPSGERAAWMALEWLAGITLEDELLRGRGLGKRSPDACFEIVRPLLSALAVVHAAGVAHRDLKPANIMMVATPSGTVPKLLDFGIAKMMEDDEAPGTGHTNTRSRQIAFSPDYASPEQISQGRSGPWTDVHAMGLIITEMLIDRHPLGADSADLATLFRQILDPDRPTPGRFGIAVGEWEAVLSRALALAPNDRYRDAGELLGALEATLADASRACAEHFAGEATLVPVDLSRREGTAAGTEPLPSNVTTGVEAEASIAMSVRRGRAAWVYVASGSAALAFAGLALHGMPTHQAEATGLALAAPVPATAAPPTSVSGEPAPVPAPVPAPAPAPPSPASAAPAPLPVETRHTSTLPAVRSKVAKPKVNCDPPFTVDSTGDRHYKPDCDN